MTPASPAPRPRPAARATSSAEQARDATRSSRHRPASSSTAYPRARRARIQRNAVRACSVTTARATRARDAAIFARSTLPRAPRTAGTAISRSVTSTSARTASPSVPPPRRWHAVTRASTRRPTPTTAARASTPSARTPRARRARRRAGKDSRAAGAAASILESDGNDCGSCGHACGGLSCVQGSCAGQIASDGKTTCAAVCGAHGATCTTGEAHYSGPSSGHTQSIGCGEVPPSSSSWPNGLQGCYMGTCYPGYDSGTLTGVKCGCAS